jgi:terminase small subunit-like protein
LVLLPLGLVALTLSFGPEVMQAYERAREIRNRYVWGEQVIDIADAKENDRDETGRMNKELVLRSKIRIEGRQWHLERAEHRRWGPKSSVAATVETSIADMTPERREAMVQEMLNWLEVIARPAMIEREKQRQLEASKVIDVVPDQKTEGGIGSESVPDASEG